MTKYRKRLLSLLLTVSMVFTMNTFAAAKEGTVEKELDVAGAVLDEGSDRLSEDEKDLGEAGWEYSCDLTTDAQLSTDTQLSTDVQMTYDKSSKTVTISNNDTKNAAEVTFTSDFTNDVKPSDFNLKLGEKSGKVDVTLYVGYGRESKPESVSVEVTDDENLSITQDTDDPKIVKFSTKKGAGTTIYTFTSFNEEEALSSNEIFGEETVKTSGGAEIVYYDTIPYTGKKLPKDITKALGNITVSKDGVTYVPKKAKIVKIKNKLPNKTVSVDNYIQITKLEIKGNASPTKEQKQAMKAVEKDVKNATKASKKQKGALPVTVYAFRLNNDTVKTLLEGAAVKGKPGKETFSFKFKDSGSKYATKDGKKDETKNLTKLTVDRKTNTLTISNNEIQGSVSMGNIDISKLKS